MAENSKVLELLKKNPGATLEWQKSTNGFALHTNEQSPNLPDGGVRIVNVTIHVGGEKILLMWRKDPANG